MQYNERLDAELKALEGDMIETLQRWIRVPSVRAERSADNAPFGENVRRALDTAMADLKRLGMEPRDVDGYCCDTEIGQGDEVIAVLSHLDVVPEGEGWAHDPYGAEIIDGRMIGRGTSDDKGPGVAALFAMKAIMNAGIPLRRRCRLILGCDEECGMQDLEYYDRKIGLPERGFSPDANFPLINTEKGGLTMKLHAAVSDERLIEIASGTRVNVVPNQAVAVIAARGRGGCVRRGGRGLRAGERAGRGRHPPDRDRRVRACVRAGEGQERREDARACACQAGNRRRADRAAG